MFVGEATDERLGFGTQTVDDDDDFLSKAELQSIQKGLEDIKNGRTYRMQEGESLTNFLKRTEACMK